MSGSSGGGFGNWNRRQEQAPTGEEEINGSLRDLLRTFNQRDAQATRTHLRTLQDALELKEDDVIPTLFGGSVSKHTAVDGLSDVDVLFMINDSSLAGRRPSEALQEMARRISQRLPNTVVSAGRMAVTIKFSDGIEIQALPAIRTSSGIRVAEPGSNQWSNVVHPDWFARKLTQVNQANASNVIPTIKLAKGMAAHAIRSDRDRISGYHMESLAIEAFRNYQGATDQRSMLRHFLEHSSRAVLQPLTDPTGQSRHVDDYLGQANSQQRQRAANSFSSMLRNLDSSGTRRAIENLFGA